MQRPLGISAHAKDGPDNRDVGMRLSEGLNRLAALRATFHSDWSDGPASLLAYATTDSADRDALRWRLPRQTDCRTPEIEPAPVLVADPPMALRGRFEATDDVDQSWLALVGNVSGTEVMFVDTPLRIDHAAISVRAEPIPQVIADSQREVAVALAFAEDCAVVTRHAELIQLITDEARPEAAPDTAIVEIDDADLVFAIGAAPGLLRLLPWPEAPVTIAAKAAPTDFDDNMDVVAYGAIAGAATLLTDLAPSSEVPPPTRDPVTEVADGVEDDGPLFGAAPALSALLDNLPVFEPVAIATRPFDPMSLIDDALADAFEALVCAPDPIDPRDAAWTPDTFADTDHAIHLAACETALWALPRRVPCIETFLLTPNHETAVRLTRALRVRADALQARAFTENAGFGVLRGESDGTALWFMADALADATPQAAIDASDDMNFADWQVSADGLIVVTAPDIAPPRRPPPLISEAELDALFAHVDDAQSRVLLDDRGDDPHWNETFWHDVDSYLEHVSEAMDPDVIDDDPPPPEDDFDIHDLEVRTAPPPTGATFFWMPGDADDLVVAGEGADLFIVGADETAAVVLVEDGATYAMRTGRDARMDEVVVSVSADPWRDIDGMDWRRIAVLAGVSQIRVTQNAAQTRCAVVAGTYFATALEDNGVRLVLSGAEGDAELPVIRVGGLAPVGWATLDDYAAA